MTFYYSYNRGILCYRTRGKQYFSTNVFWSLFPYDYSETIEDILMKFVGMITNIIYQYKRHFLFRKTKAFFEEMIVKFLYNKSLDEF